MLDLRLIGGMLSKRIVIVYDCRKVYSVILTKIADFSPGKMLLKKSRSETSKTVLTFRLAL